jgi:hypothetical protein
MDLNSSVRRSGILARYRAAENAPSPDKAPNVGQGCPTYGSCHPPGKIGFTHRVSARCATTYCFFDGFLVPGVGNRGI